MFPLYPEMEMFEPVYNYFRRLGFEVFSEVRIGFCRADILAVKKDKVVAVELKISDWKKALLQARNYQLGADYVYVCFPLPRVYNVLRKAECKFSKDGIGLLVVSKSKPFVRVIMEPKCSEKKMG